MKTTIDLPDDLARQAKELARSEHITLRELVIEGLRGELSRRQGSPPKIDFVFREFVLDDVSGEGLHPGIDPTHLTELAYDLPPAP